MNKSESTYYLQILVELVRLIYIFPVIQTNHSLAHFFSDVTGKKSQVLPWKLRWYYREKSLYKFQRLP